MSWVTIIWSMTAFACLTLAVIYFMVSCRRRSAWADLFFTRTSVGTTAYASYALSMIRAEPPAQFANALRWLQIPTWVTICRSIATARQGRLWAKENESANGSLAPKLAGYGTTLHLELPATEGKP